MKCHLGMADVQVAIRFRGESGHDLAPSGFEVCLQLSCCVGDAHLATAGLRAEGHHLVNLRAHIPLLLHYSGLCFSNPVLFCVCKLYRAMLEHIVSHCGISTFDCIIITIVTFLVLCC